MTVVYFIILVTAILSLIAAALGAYSSMRNTRMISEVHVLMNSRMDDALTRIQQLGKALQESGVSIPDDPHLVPASDDKKD